MRKKRKADLESLKGIFCLFGFCISLGVCFLAFEWRTYEHELKEDWVFIDENLDTMKSNTIEPPPILNHFTPPIPTLKPNIIKSTKSAIYELKLEEYVKKEKQFNLGINQAPDESDFLGEGSDELEPWDYKPPLFNPINKPYILSKKCSNLENNQAKYLCSIDFIRNQIKNQLHIPEHLVGTLKLSVSFQIDTLGTVNKIEVSGSKNNNIKASLKKILSRIPKMNPPMHFGEKRVMKALIPIIIKVE